MSQWDGIAEKYNALVGDTGDVYHRTYINPVILKFLGNIKGKKVLDIACGQGYFSRILANKGAEVVGVDNAVALLRIAEKKEKEKPVGLEYFCRDSANLRGLKKNSFDIVVSNMSFHDIENIRGTIKECARALRTSGRIVFSIPHPWRELSERIKDEQGYHLKLSRYKSIVTGEHFLKGDVKIYHRPVEFYLQELFKNGFFISNFCELSTKHQRGKKINDLDLLRHKQEVPSFLIVEAIKIRKIFHIAQHRTIDLKKSHRRNNSLFGAKIKSFLKSWKLKIY